MQSVIFKFTFISECIYRCLCFFSPRNGAQRLGGALCRLPHQTLVLTGHRVRGPAQSEEIE